jgi:hypothetical protein
MAAAVAVGAQQPARAGNAPKTPWGDPDLRGVWDYWTFTPLERPEEFKNKPVLTDEELKHLAAKLLKQTIAGDSEGPRSGDTGAYGQETWTDRSRANVLNQTSLIVDPPDGKVPALTPEAVKREQAQTASGGLPVRMRTDGIGTDGPEYRGLSERCILGFSTGPPFLPGGYNNNVQIFQTPDYVAMYLEMNHDVRIVPLDGRPHLSTNIRQWLGDSRGRWEGDTLVIETTNFTHKTASFSGRRGATGFELGSGENVKLIERFSRAGGKALQYEFTVNDPSTFVRPFTARFPMNLSDQNVYEYACHEGNYGLMNILRGARAAEGKIPTGGAEGTR